MNHFLKILLLTLIPISLSAKPAFEPTSIAILYNSSDPDSKSLATYYAQQRNIPATQLIGFPMPKQGHITRAQYRTTIETPLRNHFTANRWWTLTKTAEGFTIPTKNKIRLIVTIRGVPYGIKRMADPATAKLDKVRRANEASVDSELSVLGIHGIPINGPIGNKYHKSTLRFANTNFPTLILTGRIDAPTQATAKRLIDDAIATEKQGLWGMAYLDICNKGKGYKLGDDWITKIETTNWKLGIPTTTDRNKQTYLTNYPMRDVSLYYGWYTGHVNGPFTNKNFTFKRGAIAVHIHSFSGSKLRNPKRHWVGPILEKGAAATLGNVYEPYLQISHDINLFHQRLLKGFTLVEAAAVATPALSWQTVVIGDPLYTPFAHLDGSGTVTTEDKLYRAIRIAWMMWAADPDKLVQKLRSTAAKTRDGRYYEIVGLWKLYNHDMRTAAAFFNSAIGSYLAQNDTIRVNLHLANMYRTIGKNKQALAICRAALQGNEDEPAAQSLKSIINILDPPAPAPAKPRKK